MEHPVPVAERPVSHPDIYDNVLELIGNTPLIRLNRVARHVRPTMLAKVEYFNPGGSVKDRIGIRMIEDAERRGLLRPGGTIVEPTSGNTGVGLAIAAAIKGYRMIFVMPDKMSAEKIALLKAYGAEVVITPTAVPPESPESYYRVADRLARETPGGFQPNQYYNQINPETHYLTTGPEIWHQTDGKIDTFVAGVGTGGTITGTGRYLKERNPNITIVGADPEGSILSGGELRPYKVEGIGEDFWPATFDPAIIDRWVRVSDKDSFRTARRVTREEGILVGGSAGTALHAAFEVARDMTEDQTLVVLFPDTGRSYLSKLYSDQWMQDNGFLERLPAQVRVSDLLTHRHGTMPELVTVAPAELVGNAIQKLQEYGISQMPVAEWHNGHSVGDIVGSIQEKSLLARVFREPDMVERPVGEVMEEPLETVEIIEPIETIIGPLLGEDTAVIAREGEKPVGVITRSDLLEYIAHTRGNR
ncbi:MAG TPA: cystathionine beta-synthase [Chloroflexota bacterium]|nr:cystathionine beta-synthase [Chloroflexota bacterium]